MRLVYHSILINTDLFCGDFLNFVPFVVFGLCGLFVEIRRMTEVSRWYEFEGMTEGGGTGAVLP
jgi:hypothetical protein